MGRSDHADLWIGYALLASSWFLLLGCCDCQQEQESESSFVASSFFFPDKRLGPFDWTYARVELPPWFSSMTMRFISNVDHDGERVNVLPVNLMPIMCFRHGGPPLPDVSITSLENLPLVMAFNGSLGSIKSLQNVDWCLPFQKNITMTLTNDQIPPGVWYVGFFNGLGPMRTQSKMIMRGQTYTFSTALSIEGCSMSMMWGPRCDQQISQLSCRQPVRQSRNLLDPLHHSNYNSESIIHHKRRKLIFKAVNASDPSQQRKDGKFLLCSGSEEVSCLGHGEMKFYSLNVADPTLGFNFSAEKVHPARISSLNNSVDDGRILVLAYFRRNSMPNSASFDFSTVISAAPSIVQLPEVGQWFIGVRVVNRTEINGEIQESFFNLKLCFSAHWKLHSCPPGTAGPSCSWVLQSLRIFYFSSRSYYLPLGLSSKSGKFHLETLMSNCTANLIAGVSWTYLHFEIPHGSSGSNLRVLLTSDSRINHEIYLKFGGLPSVDNWDYHANTTSSANGSMILMRGNNEDTINFYIIYVTEGSWVIGIKANFDDDDKQNHQTMMAIELDSCPGNCSSHGSCRSSVDETGLSFYSFCHCDRDHGGFDCSDELVSHHGHVWRSTCLIASNVAALFPAFSALWQKAFAEWVIFTTSGVSSGLYHACDVGAWCALSFRVLQFMDFWLSFMAVISTFIFMSSLGEASKRTIHTCVAIVTALLAAAGPTRSMNVVIVLSIGAVGLLLGWILKLPFRKIVVSFPACAMNVHQRWRRCGPQFTSFLCALKRRFRWVFLLMGFIALTAAGVSWMLETHETYWIWHSAWHVSIYTASFFFLCSVRGDDGADYALTRVELSGQQVTEE